MNYSYSFADAINLYVKGRITQDDASRQQRTARKILKQLEEQPGLILADEVGMGKTFVALAVAASVAINEPRRRPVVVMVPPSLREKWPKDFRLFRDIFSTNTALWHLVYLKNICQTNLYKVNVLM